jgi:hypothetical protein
MTRHAERSARINELCTALRNERLASIRDDLADLGHPGAENISAHYILSEEYGWPVLTRLEIDGQQVADLQDTPTPFSERFAGSDTQDVLNALLIEDYDPDEGDTSLQFSFQNLPDEVPLQATACLKSSVSS